MINLAELGPHMLRMAQAASTPPAGGGASNFGMPAGGLMGILSGKSQPKGLLGMLNGAMQPQGNPFPTPIGGQETGSNANPFPTPVGSPFPTPMRSAPPMPRPRPMPARSPSLAANWTPEDYAPAPAAAPMAAAGKPPMTPAPTAGDWMATPDAYGMGGGVPMASMGHASPFMPFSMAPRINI